MSFSVRSLAATTLVTLLGTGVLWWGTDGFDAYTAEAVRRAEVLHAPRPLPAIVLEDQDGRPFSLQEYRGRLVAVDFIYTRCATLCRSLGTDFQRLRDRFPRGAQARDLALVSISFDPGRDDSARLRKYGDTYAADGVRWRIARIRDKADLEPLLQAFGVVVIPDGLGGFEHNAAIHLIDRDSRLTRISDLGEAEELAQAIEKLL